MTLVRPMIGLPTPKPPGFVVRGAAWALRPPADAAVATLHAAVNSPRTREAVAAVMDSQVAKEIVADFFDSSLFDEFVSRLLDSRGLWALVEEIAASPAVTAAIAQQGFGFADQVGGEVRSRSRKADHWLERAADHLARSRQRQAPAGNEASPDGAG